MVWGLVFRSLEGAGLSGSEACASGPGSLGTQGRLVFLTPLLKGSGSMCDGG